MANHDNMILSVDDLSSRIHFSHSIIFRILLIMKKNLGHDSLVKAYMIYSPLGNVYI